MSLRTVSAANYDPLFWHEGLSAIEAYYRTDMPLEDLPCMQQLEGAKDWRSAGRRKGTGRFCAWDERP